MFNEVHVENVYNVGEVRRYGDNSYSILNPDYHDYVENNCARLKERDNDPFGLTAEEMRSKEFAKRMGEAFAYDENNQNDGYPILSGKDVKPSGIKAVPGQKNFNKNLNLKVAVESRNVFLSGLRSGEFLALVNMKGQKVWTGRANSSNQVIPVKAPGSYVVMTKSKAIRVLVK